MYEAARAFLYDPNLTWLTVGDGTFGLDSIRLRNLGFRSVLASDIGEGLLKEAAGRGLIESYAVENAEELSFRDDSFDLVFCKESYHHFPRPSIALYEMLRVARIGVVLVEPRDFVIDHGPRSATGPRQILAGLRTWLRDRRRIPHPTLRKEELYLLGNNASYEESGNYLYTISSRELEKLALGINLPALALKGLNDVYLDWGGCDSASESSAAFNATAKLLADADRVTAGGRGATNMLMAILFKAVPERQAEQFLEANGFLLKTLQSNPYLQADKSP